jgi:hypothetical protein
VTGYDTAGQGQWSELPPIDWQQLWQMADPEARVTDEDVPPGNRLNEHGELAGLRSQVERLRLRLGAAQVWRPGIPVPEGMAADVEREYEAGVAEMARRQAQARDARRALDAEGWQPPERTASLADELALPRQTWAHRIDRMAGWDHNVLVAGPRKAGKSQLMVNLSAALSCSRWAADPATGQGVLVPGTFLGPWKQCWLGGSVAYVNAEMDADDWRDCFRALPPGTYDPSRIFPLHVRGEPFPVIASDAARAWFTGWLAEKSVEVLVIDTWGALAAKNGVRNLNDDAEARALLDGLDSIKKASGVRSLFIPIHTPHQTGERHLERFKGAGAVGDWADTLWTYVADGDGVRYLWAEGRARIAMAETALGWSPRTGQLWLGGGGSRAQTSRERQRSRAAEALTAAGERGIGAEELKDAAGGNRASAGAVIEQMLDEGIADLERRGRAKIYRLKDYRKQSDHGE